MVRKAKVELEADVAGFVPSMDAAGKATKNTDDKVEGLDRSLKKIPADAAKAAAAMKLLGDDTGKVTAKVDEFGKRSGTFSTVDQRITQTRGEVKKLAEEFNRTGDVNVLQKLFGAQKDLKELEGLKKRLSNALGDAGDSGGKEFSKNFSASTQGALSTPGLGPVLIAGLVVAAVSASPLIAAAINSAILAGVGGGALALGIAGQLHDPGVHKAFADMGNNLLGEFHRATESFRGPLIASAHIFGDALGGALKSIDFGALSKLVQPLAAGFSGFLARAMPGINQALVAAGPVLKAFADVLPAIGKGVSDMFAAFARGGPGAVEGLRAMALALIGIMRIVGFLVERLSSFFANIVGWAGGVAHALEMAFAPIKPVADFFNRIADKIDMIQNGFTDGSPMIRSLHGMGDAAQQAADRFSVLSSRINQTFQTDSMLAGQMAARLFNVMMSLDQATLAWHQSLTQLGDTVTRSSHSIDENTEAGQRNVGAIYGAVQANMQVYQSMIAAGFSAEDAAAAYDSNTAALERQLRKAGMTQQQIDGLIGKYKGVPDKVNTDIALLGIEEAINRLIELQRRLAGLPTSKEISVTTKYYTQIFGAGPEIAAPRRWGGITEHAQEGLLSAKVYSPMSPARYAFAEPSTGGEGFVPRFGDYRRSTGIIDQEARWYGGRFVAGGGAASYVDNRTVTYQINDATDPSRVVAAIKRYEQSNGRNWRIP